MTALPRPGRAPRAGQGAWRIAGVATRPGGKAKMSETNCECGTWACMDLQALMLGNGHNPTCAHYKANQGAVSLLAQLITGIEWWASQEDGVPEELWEPYSRAAFIVRGSRPEGRPS